MSLDRAKQAVRVLLGRDGAGRNVTVFDSDIILCSYPKSGNTWTRFLVANMIGSSPATFSNIEQVVPDIYMWDDAKLKVRKKPRVLKSHEYFDPRYKRVVYIVRDPRDVAVSYYHHHIKFNLVGSSVSMSDFIKRFTEGELDSFGSWGENVGSWLGARKSDSSFLILRYEDLLQSPLESLRKLAKHMRLELSDVQLVDAMEHSSFDNMRAMEVSQGGEWKPLKSSQRDIPFVRAGKSGGWKKTLKHEDVEYIESAWGGLMYELGYLS